ncbi:aldehyde dehydrogenase [Abortiporus biennis]|nr:aldehyde dehydrogenase [Abortiporus biennis]
MRAKRVATTMQNAMASAIKTGRWNHDKLLPHALHTKLEDPLDPESSKGGREELVIRNPATEEDVGMVFTASGHDVRTAISDAQNVFNSGVWSRSSPIQRSTVLAAMASTLADPEVNETFAMLETLQTGRAIREMKAQLSRLPEWLDYYAALLRMPSTYVPPTPGNYLNYVERVPLGVVAQITPFNHPLFIAVKKIVPALAAGNSVIVKPSELAPMSVLNFAKLAEAAGLPPGVLSVLPGFGRTTGNEIISHPDIKKVDLTGGTKAGREIGAIVGSNLASYTAELGGKAPVVIFDDADPVAAANGAAFACFIASGQTCVSGTRIIVQDKIADEFMHHFLKKVDIIRKNMGNPMNPQTSMGTVISPLHLKRIEHMVNPPTKRKGSGRIIVGGQRLTGPSDLDGFDFGRGSFFPPTVITDVSLDDELWEEEVFGPVVVVKRFKEEKEGVDLANNCKYGLGAGIWTQDLSRAHRVAKDIQAGVVWVNAHHRNSPASPWGGMKESGIGRENGVEALNAYTQSKSVSINFSTMKDIRDNEDWFVEDESKDVRYG